MTPLIIITLPTFLVKTTMKLSGCLFFEKTRKNFVFVVALVLESEGLYLETDGLNETRSSYKLKVTNGELAGAFFPQRHFSHSLDIHPDFKTFLSPDSAYDSAVHNLV